MTRQPKQPATHGRPRASLSDIGTSRRQILAAAGAGGALLLLPGHPETASAARRAGSTKPGGSIVVSWNQAFLEGVRGSKLGPPMVARALAIGHTCIYDAWAAYDRKAVGTRLGASLRRPPAERTLPNIRQAISFAACRAASDLFPGSISSVFDPLMQTLGYDPGDLSTDTSTPTGVGNVAARAVLDFRHRDGANQLGDEPGGIPGVPYSDYTGYTPANAPMDIRFPFDPTTVHDPSTWQPLRSIRQLTMTCRARLSWRSPKGLSRCRVILPEDASSGLTPARAAKAAWERNRPGWDHETSSWAVLIGPTPGWPGRAGITWATSWRGWALPASSSRSRTQTCAARRRSSARRICS